ncbi:lipid phosphate phosphatase-related protein type 5 [Columba livia]|uniref:Phospholipid phosphatase-related protein type 5 n=1 Tax=Columba livia TaxID=8932 RepID=A0A2I0MDW0_COLLI|nr:lipid phosphate phosphatase-related protein type 5 [Columba livia]
MGLPAAVTLIKHEREEDVSTFRSLYHPANSGAPFVCPDTSELWLRAVREAPPNRTVPRARRFPAAPCGDGKGRGGAAGRSGSSPARTRPSYRHVVKGNRDITLPFLRSVPLLIIIVGETAVFCLQIATKDFENQEKTILTGDCCYINPLVRRTIRFLGIYAFGLFATDIFVNAGQVVTGNLAPHFLALCKPNYTALGCKQYTQFISSVHACTGNPDLIMKARKTFPSKEAALSVYAAMYLAMYITNTVKARGTRLAKPVLCLGLMCLAFLTGINRVAEYRNHWSDVIAGFVIGISIAVFLVVCVVNNFRGRQPEHEHSHMDNLAQMPMISIPRVESPLEKNHITAFAEVT